MNIEQIPTYDIKPYENNAKKHTDAQIEEIAKSIHDFGFNQNLVIDKNNVLVVGHGRWEAAKLLGLETVPCVRAENLTDEQIRLYRLVDNRVATTPIDVEIELAELESIDLDISDYSFDLGEMQVEVEARQEAHEKSKDEYETDLAKIENIHKGIFEGEGLYDMPALEAVTELPPIKEWIGFNYVLSDKDPEGKAVHFFVDDYQFERVWNNPEKYLDKLKQYVCVSTPDFSPYENMPHVLQHTGALEFTINGTT